MDDTIIAVWVRGGVSFAGRSQIVGIRDCVVRDVESGAALFVAHLNADSGDVVHDVVFDVEVGLAIIVDAAEIFVELRSAEVHVLNVVADDELSLP